MSKGDLNRFLEYAAVAKAMADRVWRESIRSLLIDEDGYLCLGGRKIGRVRGADGQSVNASEVADVLRSDQVFCESLRGKDGKDSKAEDVAELLKVDEDFQRSVRPKDGEDGEDGKDADPVEVARLLSADAKFREAVRGKDGKSVTPKEVAALLSSNAAFIRSVTPVVAKPKDGKDGEDGRDADPVEVARLLMDSEKFRAKVKGSSGVGIIDVKMDARGHLIIYFTDGTKKDVGRVKGEDGGGGSVYSQVTVEAMGDEVIIKDEGGERAQVEGSRLKTHDVFSGGEVLPDQSLTNEVGVFTFSQPVDMVWVRSDGSDCRIDPFGGTPDAATGIKGEDGIATPVTVRASVVRVYASGANVNVYGYRY